MLNCAVVGNLSWKSQLTLEQMNNRHTINNVATYDYEVFNNDIQLTRPTLDTCALSFLYAKGVGAMYKWTDSLSNKTVTV